MRPPSSLGRALRWLLALCLLAQSATAAAHGLAMADRAGSSFTVICTSDGLQQMPLDSSSDEAGPERVAAIRRGTPWMQAQARGAAEEAGRRLGL